MKIQLESSTACNANCTFCPRRGVVQRHGTMSDELFHKIVANGRQLRGAFFIPFLNGEPFLFPRIWEWLDYLKSDRVHIYTNASLVDVGRLSQYKNITTICCSINAATKETYGKVVRGPDYDLAVSNTKQLIRTAPGRVYASMVVVDANKLEVPAFQQLWGRHAIFGRFTNWAGSVHDPIEVTGRKIPCWPLTHSINILHDGRAVACCMDHDGKLVLGNAKTQTLQEIWHAGRKLRQRHRNLDFSMEPCNICNHNIPEAQL